MSTPSRDPFKLTAEELRSLLGPAAPLFPELEAARNNLQALRDAPQTQIVLGQTESLFATIDGIPQTPYTLYRLFRRNGDRKRYETPYFEKRRKLAAIVLRLWLNVEPQQTESLRDSVHDYLWSICEETNWVVPAHEDRIIDLFSAETGFVLAETLHLLGNGLAAEVRHRVRQEIERRIFDPYLRYHRLLSWYKGHNNWNGVCNSSVAATFLVLEPEPARAAQALEIALNGLQVFLAAAFEPDGSSTEGVAYWHYGLSNFVALSEMLRSRSGGAIDLLDSEHMRKVAAYPAKMLLSGSWFASFSDCDETVAFSPGMVVRLAERTGERSLLDLLARPVEPGADWRLTRMLRDLLWWDGSQREAAQVDDAVLPSGGVARLVARTPTGAPVVLAIKAGHNAENHNQNDVGSFLLHVDGENLLTDPGRGLYTRAYFSAERYRNIFANSYGHSVPRIAGQLQQAGRQFAGQLVGVETQRAVKQAEIEFARAYPVEELVSARRTVQLIAEGEQAGTAWLQDEFHCVDAAGAPPEVEEAFVTWADVTLDGATATVHGQRHKLRLMIERPQTTAWSLERLEEQSRANAKPAVLKRLSFVLPVGIQQTRIRMEVVAAETA